VEEEEEEEEDEEEEEEQEEEEKEAPTDAEEEEEIQRQWSACSQQPPCLGNVVVAAVHGLQAVADAGNKGLADVVSLLVRRPY